MSGPVVLCILDGWGLSDAPEGNAPYLARTPVMDEITGNCPNARLVTHGRDVGLPTGQMGNSEVGHTNIGAGRVVAMNLGQIDMAIEDGSFFSNGAILDFAARVRTSGGRAHVIGLASDGGVHAHLAHMRAAVSVMQDSETPVVVHTITDGRDVAPSIALDQLGPFESALKESGVSIATVSGRYFAMDRDNRWDRVEQAYRTIVDGEGARFETARDGISEAYEAGQTDEFIAPFVVGDYEGISPGDGVFFINFRADRAREILAAIGDPEFDRFERRRPKLSALLGMVDYSEQHSTYVTTVFPKRDLQNTLGEWVAKQGKRQFRLAETEKYPHVTFFLNGGVEPPFEGEDRHMPASPKVATYDLAPEMSAREVTEKLVEVIGAGYDLIVVNYANPDMVGHTGDIGAAIQACEAVDAGLGKALDAVKAAGGSMIVTADHGNCETMIDPQTREPHTAHSTNLVPVVLVGGPADAQVVDGRLADLAPTVLALMGLPKPEEMTGVSLIR